MKDFRVTAPLLLAAMTTTTASGDEGLALALQPMIAAHKGDVAIAVRRIGDAPAFLHRADEPMATASLIKTAVMVTAYRQAAESKLRLEEPVELRDADRVPGSGLLTTHFSAGARFPLRDAIRLMIAYSDNTATNLVLQRLGIDATARSMEQLGLRNTKIHSMVYRRDSSVFPERSVRFGLGSTTARETVELFTRLHEGELGDKASTAAMLEHLSHCQDRDSLPRFLPADAKIWFKTGATSKVRTAAGILATRRGPVVVCVLTENNEDQRWTTDNAGDLLCAKVGKAVHDHFSVVAAGKASAGR